MKNRIKKKHAHNEVRRKARAEGGGKSSKLYDICTGKPAPEEASLSEQYINFFAYVRRHVKQPNLSKTTYVNAKTGQPAPGITKETHQQGQHTTLYTWLVRQKYAAFSKILEEGGDLPPVPLSKKNTHQNAQAADLPLAPAKNCSNKICCQTKSRPARNSPNLFSV